MKALNFLKGLFNKTEKILYTNRPQKNRGVLVVGSHGYGRQFSVFSDMSEDKKVAKLYDLYLHLIQDLMVRTEIDESFSEPFRKFFFIRRPYEIKNHFEEWIKLFKDENKIKDDSILKEYGWGGKDFHVDSNLSLFIAEQIKIFVK